MLTIDLYNGLKIDGSLIQTSRFSNRGELGTVRANAFIDGLMALGARIHIESIQTIEDGDRIEVKWKTVAPAFVTRL